MPVKARDFKQELQAFGYAIERTKRGHFNVINQMGLVIGNYAVGHGRNKSEVLDCYVCNVRNAIKRDQQL